MLFGRLLLLSPLIAPPSNRLQGFLVEVPDEPENIVEAVEMALEHLTVRQSQVVRLRFGLEGWKPMDFAKIGSIIGRSEDETMQIYNEAISRLQRSEFVVTHLLPYHMH